MVELLVTLAVTGLVLAGTLTLVLSSRALFAKDRSRIGVQRNLRDALQVLGVDLRQAGERLPGDFVAIVIEDGTAGAPDTLVLRRNLLSEVLPLCGRLASGTTDTEMQVADSTAPPPGCNPVPDGDGDGWPDNIGAWRAWRDAHGGSVPVFVFSPVARAGEWTDFAADGGTGERIGIDGGAWSRTYEVAEQCRVYALEEKRYTLQAGVLQYVRDAGAAPPLAVASRLTDFQVTAVLADGTRLDAWDGSLSWSDLAAVEVALTGRDEEEGRSVTQSRSARFFPRNVLSN
jgi:type IV pilus assembly protein PilW